MNFPENDRKVGMGLYNGARVRILSGEGWTNKIIIRRDMKQGCPMSTFLFQSFWIIN
jgi:hypothetical protein